MRLTRIAQVARLDLADVRRSRWLSATVIVYGALLGIFVLIGMRESSVLGFTGLGRVLINFSHALVLLLPLLALSATAQVIPRAREDGTLELLMSQPLSRSDYFWAVAFTRTSLLIAPLVLLTLVMAGFAAWGLSEPVPWQYLGSLLLASTTLILAFVGIGLLISATCRNSSRTLIYSLLAWVTGVALLDFALVGMMLQWRLNPETIFTLAALNPVQDARLILLSSADPELSILGPVGFFMSNHLGSTWLYLIGAGWPTLLGLASAAMARSHFERSDLLG